MNFIIKHGLFPVGLIRGIETREIEQAWEGKMGGVDQCMSIIDWDLLLTQQLQMLEASFLT
jgi:hypothetical protein